MNSRAIAVVGENLVDLLVSPGGNVQAVVGGGPLNVARTIGRLGASAHFVSGISNDAFGSLVRRALDDSQVRIMLPQPLAQPTTLAVVQLGPDGPRYDFHLRDTAAFCLEPAAVIAAVAKIPRLGALYLGTLGLLVEPMASLGETLVTKASRDTLVVLDPNCRPSAVQDPNGYRARVTRLCARADVVKVSTEDLAYLFPDLTETEGSRRILHDGARCVIVTRGAEPVSVLHRDFEFTIEVAPTEVVDTVGAGDALVGGFLAWWTGRDLTRQHLDEGTTVAGAVAGAVEISRLNCQRSGASPPRRSDVAHSAGWDWL